MLDFMVMKTFAWFLLILNLGFIALNIHTLSVGEVTLVLPIFLIGLHTFTVTLVIMGLVRGIYK